MLDMVRHARGIVLHCSSKAFLGTFRRVGLQSLVDVVVGFYD